MTPELARYLEEALGRLRAALDLPVVARTSLPPLERIGLVLELLKDAPLPAEAIVLTPGEFQERRDLPFLQGVLRKAKPLYERGKAPA